MINRSSRTLSIKSFGRPARSAFTCPLRAAQAQLTSARSTAKVAIKKHGADMTTFLATGFEMSLSVILLIFCADRWTVKVKINGSNGLLVQVALIASFLGSPIVALIAAVFGGWSMMGLIVLITIHCHVGLAALLSWSLKS